MKYLKRLGSVLLALVMVMALAAPAFATSTSGSITLKNPEGVTDNTTFGVYKVFDLVLSADNKNFSYSTTETIKDLIANASGDDAAVAGFFTFEDQGNGKWTVIPTDKFKTEANAKTFSQFLAKHTEDLDKVQDVTVSGQEEKTISVGYGYYFVDSTVGSLCMLDSTTPNVTITDKNEGTNIKKTVTFEQDGDVTKLDKDGKAALAQIGTKVPYQVRIPIAEGAKDYKFSDTMSTGLTYNNDMKVYVVNTGAEVVAGTPEATGYGTPSVNGQTIGLAFNESWLAANENKDIVITYSATVNSSAVTANGNTASITWGNDQMTSTDKATVYTAKITVFKVDGDNKPLEGAGFILKNEKDEYYALDEKGNVIWVTNEKDAKEFIVTEVNGKMQAIFNGLAAGKYVLIEKTVPEGYNKAADKEIEITGKEDNSDTINVEHEVTVTNKSGTELPETGGIGTTIFYVVGGILVVGAVVLLITKRRASVDDE